MPARCTAATSKPRPSSSTRTANTPGCGNVHSTHTRRAWLCLMTLDNASSTSRVSSRHCSALGQPPSSTGPRHCAAIRHSLATPISSSRRVTRWRSGAAHCTGVAGTVAPALDPWSITWRRSSRSVLSSDSTRSPGNCPPACSSSAMPRTRLPPRPSCRSCAICMRSCSLALSSACACSRATAWASSARASATRASSSRWKRSALRICCASWPPSSSMTSTMVAMPLSAAQLRATCHTSGTRPNVNSATTTSTSQHSASSRCATPRPGRQACHWNCSPLSRNTAMAPRQMAANQALSAPCGAHHAAAAPRAASSHSARSAHGRRCAPKRKVNRQAHST